MSATVITTIDIDAGPQAVWDVLTDFPAYPEWNPFMDRIDGTAEAGSRLVVHLAGRGGRGTTFRPRLLVATPGEELSWIGRLGPGGLFDGLHSFVLTVKPDGTTRLTHSERFTGILVTLFKGATANSHAGFTAFNEALRRRVESGQSRGEDAGHEPSTVEGA
ncbi:SRPBCC domain-containing protein [Actinotalea sp. K2]|uniref:SRPBCC domain-containing protein n=1 Tax=Actinotalea sp. K2 TaxID=2939438 RepID=UPI0020182BE4|nr:SRPBCC domain-containing protein [Actinotalea sp. K2]MCL3859602.1 SRPBCC domain-containing protein [Actinotalea sp. K2]